MVLLEMGMEIKDDSYREKTMAGITCFYDFANPLILAIILILLTMLSFTASSSAAADHSALLKLISQNEIHGWV